MAAEPLRLVAAHHCPEAAPRGAELLEAEWPLARKGARLEQLLESNDVETHWLLVECSPEACDRTVGHAKLGPIAAGSDGKGGLVHSVVVDPALRGRGLGRLLMTLLEGEALGRGMGALYLSTHDKQSFYEALGYTTTETAPARGAAAAVVRLGERAVEGLEAALAGLARRAQAGGGGAATAGVPGAGPRGVPAVVTWFRKRLAWVGPLDGVSACSALDAAGVSHSLVTLPWRRQLGPTCGLSMLLAAAEAAGCDSSGNGPAKTIADRPQGLFEWAAEQGLTRDGEMCSARWMTAVARHHGFAGAVAVALKTPESLSEPHSPQSAGAGSALGTVAIWSDVCAATADAPSEQELMHAAAASVLSQGLARGHPVLFPVDRDPAGGATGSGIGMLAGSGAHWVAVVGMWTDAEGAATVAFVDGIRRTPTVVSLRHVVDSCAQLWHFGAAKLRKYSPALHPAPLFRPPHSGVGLLDLAQQCVVLA